MVTKNITRRTPRAGGAKQSDLPFMPTAEERLELPALEAWLWAAACVIRGAQDAPKYKDFILPLIFYKRLSDVYEDEFNQIVEEYGDQDFAAQIIADDHENYLKTNSTPIVRFFIPTEYRWDAIRNHAADGHLGEFVTEAMRVVAKNNPDLQGVLDVKDYNERQSGQRTLEDDRLAALIERISQHRLGLKNTEPDILGRAYEYLLRKFAEDGGQSAGEFFTPKEVGWLMAELINPDSYATVYDPACGSAGLLIKIRMLFETRHPDKKSQAPVLFGQELNSTTFAMAKMNMFLHGYTDAKFAIGDSFVNPGHGANNAGLKTFRYVVANPMWNQDGYTESFYSNDSLDRFKYGVPPNSSADWGWAQHMLASLDAGGQAAIVLDTGAVSRGSGSKSNNREKEIRKAFVENDWIEGVVLLPENLFYNTSAPGIILLLNRNKQEARKDQIMLINASAYFKKGKPKNELTDEGIAAVAGVFHAWETREKLSRVITIDEARTADYNLSPSQFVEVGELATHRPLASILADLQSVRDTREKADTELMSVLAHLGLQGDF